MRINRVSFILFSTFFGLVLAAAAVSAASVPGIPDGCGTRCHKSKVREEFVHGPVGSDDCIACHNPTGLEHPKNRGAFRLPGTGTRLCAVCHESKATKKVVHLPVADGGCLDCHDVHQSPNRMMLKAEGAALCFGCHDKGKFTANHGHSPVTDGSCLSCHDPHESDNRALLRHDKASLCFSCHDKKMAEGVSIHRPVAQGECLSCHSPHGSAWPNIMKGAFPEPFYLPYAQGNFDLCFGCHPKDIAQDRRTDTLTGFRNGDYNLHYLHINKPDKGRSCKTCHDAHAASQPRLIKERIPGFGTWDIPIRYTRTDSGGSCVAGCHKPKSYDRLRQIKNP
ncbi:MAG: cytochrome C [Desulfuromonadales bacterium]|nr:MAG: cytochrome C [Desulfuromonadales bacterium]